MSLTLFRGGSIYSPADPFATAMLVDGDRIAWLGEDGAADAHRDAAHTVVDLRGALVAPGFVDAHVHATSAGLALTGLDLSATRSLAEALDAIDRETRRVRGGLVLGHGWDETRWPEGRPPSRAELDRAAFGGHVYLSRIDVHSAVVSSSLLLAVGVEAADPDLDDGRVVRSAHHRVREGLRRLLPPSQVREAQRAARSHAAALGIVSLHEMGGPAIAGDEDLRGLLALAASEAGPQIVGYWGEAAESAAATPGGATPGGASLALVAELGLRGAAGDLFIDGALGSHTAWLKEPYADAEHCGSAYLDAQQVCDHLVACTRAGVQGGFHVIGDAGTEAFVDGLRRAAEILGDAALRAGRHRVEHLEMVTADQAALMSKWGVLASVQPVFDALWGGPGAMYEQRLGARRSSEMNNLAGLASAGVPLAISSDAPVTPLGPWEAIRAAAQMSNPAHRISVRAAFSAHTRGGWRAAGVDDAGMLVPGAPAHFAVWQTEELVVQAPDSRVSAWSTDPRSGVPGLPNLDPGVGAPRCAMTFVAGVPVHDAGLLSG